MDSSKIKFEYGRHGTFHLREGWLALGIREIHQTGNFIPDKETADRLGLGSQMVKSLAFWLEATNLVVVQPPVKGEKKRSVLLSPLGKLIAERDPYFEFAATLWMVHLNLASRAGTIWHWYYNVFNQKNFSREACIDAFIRYMNQNASNQAVLKTCQREVSCLLGLYSKPSSAELLDPEDGTVSEFRSLELMRKNYDTGNFERTTPLDRIPIEVFLATVSHMISSEKSDTSMLRLSELIAGKNSPGRLLELESNMILELAEESSTVYNKKNVGISLQGADRYLSFPNLKLENWLEIHYNKLKV